jgi:DNA-binding transcriptional ArsR family regulator
MQKDIRRTWFFQQLPGEVWKYLAFQVIAGPGRRQVLVTLSKDSMTINSLAENFDVSRPAVSRLIKILYNPGFISVKTSAENGIAL